MKYYDGTNWVEINIKALDSMPIGSIMAYAGTTIPDGWLECNGGSISQSTYPDLYTLIGGTLPNLKGKVIVGQDTSDTSFDTLGETGGSKTNTLSIENYRYKTWNSDTSASGNDINTNWQPSGSLYGLALKYSSNTNTPVNNLQPYAVYKWIIKAINRVPTMASVVDGYGTSNEDAYSCNYINNSIGKIESGVITTDNMSNATIAGDSGKKKTITFTNTYTTPPNVVVCYYNKAPATYGNINVFVSNITTTGCDLYFCYNISNNNLGVSYIVNGK